MNEVAKLMEARAAYHDHVPTLEAADPHAAAFVAAVDALLSAHDDRRVIVLPPKPSLDGRELVEAYTVRSVADPDLPDERPEDVAVARALQQPSGSYVANEARRQLRNADRALRDMVLAYGRQLRDLHRGALPETGAGLDQDRRDLAENVAQLRGLTNGLINSTHVPIVVERPDPEEG